MKILITSLKKLTQTFAVSGYEWELGMAKVIQTLIGFKGERIGDNLVYTFGKSGKKILLIAHMDEVGFIVSKQSPSFFSVVPIGDIGIDQLINEKLNFVREKKVLLTKTIKSVFSFASLKLTGCTVNVGDIGTFQKTFLTKGSLVFAPSLDNKVGCLVLIEIIKTLKNKSPENTISVCFACREEVGPNGVMIAVRAIKPDLCIDIDAAYAQPLLDMETTNWSIPRMGKGPALQLLGDGFIISGKQRRFVEAIARKNNLLFQYEIPEGNNGGTNASQLMNAGYEVLQLNVPVANQHSAKSTVSIKDIFITTQLLQEILKALTLFELGV